MKTNIVYNESCLTGLKKLPADSVDVCVTSPPYFNLRDYGTATWEGGHADCDHLQGNATWVNGKSKSAGVKQIQRVKCTKCGAVRADDQVGLEDSPEEYIATLTAIFEEVRRVLKPEGTLWLNIGDSYATSSKNRTVEQSTKKSTLGGGKATQILKQKSKVTGDLKAKDLIGIPWMLAFALRGAGWYLRQDIIWAKRNCMPESVKDRCTKSHEYIFMFSKSEKYYYDQEAIMEPAIWDIDGSGTLSRKARQKEGAKSEPQQERAGIRRASLSDARLMDGKNKDKQRGHGPRNAGFNQRWENSEDDRGMRNKRDVWFISPAQFPEAHFATFPEEIPAICIKAGAPRGGVVLDPFMGAGTTAMVARKLERNFIGFELNAAYIKIMDKRMHKELGFFL